MIQIIYNSLTNSSQVLLEEIDIKNFNYKPEKFRKEAEQRLEI